MQIIETVSELLAFVERGKERGLKSGLVPTMGALHEGHLSLVKRSKEDNDITIVSIFVNPIQFNNPEDLATYPRKQQEDFKLLALEGVDVVFAPTEKEIYPDGFDKEKKFKLGTVAEVMEGQYRSGHFQGVALIVNRLFKLCRPTHAYFGMKDFQQIVVIQEMIRTEGLDVEIISCPIIREATGLALSSRNQLLEPEEKQKAPIIYETLKQSVEYAINHSVEETREWVIKTVNKNEGFKVEYFEIVDGETLLPIEQWDECKYIMGCITVYLGKVRLIDNIQFK